MRPLFLPVGPQTLLVELADRTETQALFDALLAHPLLGVIEIVPAARTLMIRTALGTLADGALAAEILALPQAEAHQAAGESEIVELPMTYDGEDLADVAAHMGLSVAELVERHQKTLWQVAFCGFAPGFAYMTCDDPGFDLPRRPVPRTRIPAGSVALAGRFCGVYPQETPGGWQVIGRTQVPMWDLDRDPPALLRPGLRCRFVARKPTIRPVKTPASRPQPAEGLRMLASAFPILMQDEGRPGQAGQGISTSGALDKGAMHRANRAVGNPATAPVLEITLGPVRLRADRPMVLALTGAAQAVLAGRKIDAGAPFALDAGDTIAIEPPAAGMRSYLALRGGYAVAPVLGSAATDTLAHIGPPPLIAGCVIAPADSPATATGLPEPQPSLPQAGDVVELPVTLGPRADWFAPAMVRHFLDQAWLVTPQSSRVGIRLHGAQPLIGRDKGELPSEGTETGAIQVPHSGQPVLFLADHPLTGGYPVIATLLPQALDLAGQIPPGALIRFTAMTAFAPIQPTRSKPRSGP